MGKSFLFHGSKYLPLEWEPMVSFSFAKREVIILAVLLLVAFLVRVLLFPLEGAHGDLNCYVSWFNSASETGVRSFYTVMFSNPATDWVDYPPFNVYIFWGFGNLANALAHYGVNAINIVKLVPNLFDIGIALLIYFFVRKQLSFKQSLLAVALYAFNPAVIYDAAVWGQFDAIYTFFLVLSLLFALKSKPELSAVSFALGILTKPQGIALLPLLVVLILKKNGLKRMLTSIAAFTATIFLVILPMEWSNPVTFLSRVYFGAYNHYQYTSINAFNLWGMFGLWIPDGGLYSVGWALFGAFAAFTLYVLYKRFHVSGEMLAVFAAFMLFFSFFMLPTRIHERYLFPAISMLALMFPLVKKTRLIYAVLTGTLLVNQIYVMDYLNRGQFIPSGDLVVISVSVINLVMFLFSTVLLWDELKGRALVKAVEPLPQTMGGEPPK